MTLSRSSLSPLKVAFQGVLGANSEIAALSLASSWPDRTLEPMGFEDFASVLEAVETGVCDLAVLPVENSLAGSVLSAIDLLFSSDLYAVGEVRVRVRHQLLAPLNTPLESVKRVYSHPQALAQCAGFLKKHGMIPVPAYDTAGAAQDLARSKEVGAACIATARAGELYALETLQSDIEDEEFNITRFFVLSGEHLPTHLERPYKTSVVFAVRNQAGNLIRCLNGFAQLNMTKIESRPRRDRPWSYLIYVDFEGHTEDPRVQAALSSLMSHASVFKVIGCYPAAQDEVG